MIRFNRFGVHYLVFVMIFIGVILGFGSEVLGLFLFVSLHEIGHIVVARIFGVRLKEVLISPLGESAIFENLDVQKLYKKVIILLSGVCVNLVCYWLLILFFPNRFENFRKINVGLIGFNLLPITPLDGGNILYYLICKYFGVINGCKFMSKINSFVTKIFIGLGFVQVILFPFNVSLMSVGIFLSSKIREEYAIKTANFFKIVTSKNYLQEQRILECKNIIYCGEISEMELVAVINFDYFFTFTRIENDEIVEFMTQKEMVDKLLL